MGNGTNSKGRAVIPAIITGIVMFVAGFFISKQFSGPVSGTVSNQAVIEKPNVKRYGKVIKVKPEKLDYYKKLHAEPWPEVLKALYECNLRNFSIYYRDGYLFSYYEYIGSNYDADMKKLSELTAAWLKETDPCQQPVESAKPGEWWAEMEEVFHTN